MNKILYLTGFAIIALFLISCAPGNDRWNQEINPGHLAGFWAGLWHGLIIIVTFIISLFSRDVGIYEVYNTGWAYDLGFLIGLCFSVLAPWRMKPWIHKRKYKLSHHDWREIGDKIEERVRHGLKSWLAEEKKAEKEKEWEEIAANIEENIKKSIHEWLDEKD